MARDVINYASIHQSINQPYDEETDQSINQSNTDDTNIPPINQSINGTDFSPINQSINRPPNTVDLVQQYMQFSHPTRK